MRQIGNLIIGKKIPDGPPTIDLPAGDVPSSTPPEKGAENEKESGNGDLSPSETNGGSWRHAVTESEWEQAQRATRTATWGKFNVKRNMRMFSNKVE